MREKTVLDVCSGKEINKMKTDFNKYIYLVPFFLLVSWIPSCSGRAGNASKSQNESPVVTNPNFKTELVKMVSPAENAEYKLKDQIRVSLIPADDKQLIDSVKVFFDGKIVALLKAAPWECPVGSSFTAMTGRKSVKAVAYTKEKSQSVTRFVIVYSDVVPKRYSYKVINTYPHDKEAFTQGLFYDNGILYEGTGQETGSSLREVELETGKVLRQHNLDPSLFGEGITLYKDRIYQVTWRNKVGFIYNRSDFRVINKIFIQTEGWGLTTMNDRIIMSDGSNVLYFHEPEVFDAASRIEVYDNEKKVDQLNELEYIDGEIWANIWQTDMIARIDPLSGKVNSYIDMSPLFPEAKRREVYADVLNGIAWDAKGRRIFVTGKRWPKLYEIKITE
jgi:glutamine cyclotransferase